MVPHVGPSDMAKKAAETPAKNRLGVFVASTDSSDTGPGGGVSLLEHPDPSSPQTVQSSATASESTVSQAEVSQSGASNTVGSIGSQPIVSSSVPSSTQNNNSWATVQSSATASESTVSQAGVSQSSVSNTAGSIGFRPIVSSSVPSSTQNNNSWATVQNKVGRNK
ncbi:hypothetical protein B0H67DRAFT_607876, partial [Lasiosphaeris hirsuta]